MEKEKFKIKNGVLIKYEGDDEIIEIPNTVSIIGEGVFANIVGIEKIIIPDSVKIIEKNAFKESGFYEMQMADSVERIEESAFENVTFGTDLKLSNRLQKIGKRAFYSFEFYDGPMKIKIPDSVIEIEEDAFSMSMFKEIILPKNLKKICRNAFSDMSEITKIEIPGSLQVIEYGAFMGCYQLENVEIKDGIIEIRENVFESCSELKEIRFPNTLKLLKSDAFSFCESLKKINISTKCFTIEPYTFVRSNIEEIYIFITESIDIKKGAFDGLQSLKKIKIVGTKYSKINIGDFAFSKCSRLEEINIVTEGDVNIEDYSFEKCTELEEVNIIADKIDIGKYSFEGCTLLKRLTLQGHIMGVKIGEMAFANCNILHTVNILNSTVHIYEDAFKNCISLEKLNCGKIVTLIKEISLLRCTLEEVNKIIKSPEEIRVSLKSREKENFYKLEEVHDEDYEESQRDEQVEEILQKLDQIDKSIKESSKDREYNTGFDRGIIDDIVEGIWEIL